MGVIRYKHSLRINIFHILSLKEMFVFICFQTLPVLHAHLELHVQNLGQNSIQRMAEVTIQTCTSSTVKAYLNV